METQNVLKRDGFRQNIEARLDLIKSAQRRGSYSFLAIVIASSAFIVGLYNTFFSWDKKFAFLENYGGEEVTKQLQKDLLTHWVSNSIVDIDLLGIRISSSDFTILGGFALTIISLWFLLSIKRENSTIGSFLIDTKGYDSEEKEAFYHFIVSNQIFASINDDKPLKSLNQEIGYLQNSKMWINKIDELMFYLPFAAIFSSMIADVFSVFVLSSPFRPDKNSALVVNLSGGDLWGVALIIAVGLFFSFMAYRINKRSSDYAQATRSILSEYERSFLKDKEQK